jgi:hypothetical protein
MTAALIDQLHEVGASCAPLAAWCRCESGRVDRCEKCILGSPEVCDAQVVKALVGKIVAGRLEFDQMEQQKEYWKGVAERVASAGMNADRIKEF